MEKAFVLAGGVMFFLPFVIGLAIRTISDFSDIKNADLDIQRGICIKAFVIDLLIWWFMLATIMILIGCFGDV